MADQTTFILNGSQVKLSPVAGERLSESLRERLGVRDVKIGCNAGDCGACSVLLDGKVVCACLTSTQQADNRQVETLAGLIKTDPHAQKLVESFQDHGAAQCGICTPGMMVSAVALLRDVDTPSEVQVQDALSGVLCRCTGYRKIIDAVRGVDANTLKDGGNVGDAIRRVDGLAKVSGSECFGDDVAPLGSLEIKVIRSPFARASFVFGDLDAYLAKHNGIKAILTADDIQGLNCFGVIPDFADQPVFAQSVAKFRGEAVAAVVGTPAAIRDFVSADFSVSWNELPNVATVMDALADNAPLLHEDRAGNVMCGGFVACGDPKAALADADVAVEGSFTSGFVEHAYIEPEAGYAEIVNGRVEVHACTQAPVMDLDALEIILGMDRKNIRIIPTGVGGGFGAKLDISVQPYLALAALKPVSPFGSLIHARNRCNPQPKDTRPRLK